MSCTCSLVRVAVIKPAPFVSWFVLVTFVAPLAMPSSFEPSEATSLPSTVPVTEIFPETSRPEPTSKFPATSTVPSDFIINLADPTLLAVPDVPKTIL